MAVNARPRRILKPNTEDMIIIRNNLIPFRGYSAVTIWPIVFVRRGAWYSRNTDRHERIHGRQQLEMLLVGMVLAAVLAAAGCGWWSLLALPLFYLCYGVEYLIRLCITRDHDCAYRSISFEQEAFAHQFDETYLQYRRWFAWLRYIFKA